METILRGLDALKGAHDQVRHELTAKLDWLEKDVAAGQEETTQLVVKRIKREPAQPQFKRKGNEKQFIFNAQISDSVQTAVGLLDKIKPEQPQAAAILKTAKEQLEEGMQAITDRQKLIRFADRSQYGWGAVEEYLQEDIAKDEKEAKKWADAEKSMEAKMSRKRTLDDRGYSDGDPQHIRPMPPPPPVCPPPPPPQPLMSARAFGPRGPPPRMPGPCFNCLQMGHLKAQCPMGTTRLYPLSNVLLGSMDSSKSIKQKEVIVPYKSVDCILADTTHSGAHNTLLSTV